MSSELGYYKDLFKTMLVNCITPLVTVYHWALPQGPLDAPGRLEHLQTKGSTRAGTARRSLQPAPQRHLDPTVWMRLARAVSRHQYAGTVDGAHALVVLTEWDEFKTYPYPGSISQC